MRWWRWRVSHPRPNGRPERVFTSLVRSQDSEPCQGADELTVPTPFSRRADAKASSASRSVSDGSPMARIKPWGTGPSDRLRRWTEQRPGRGTPKRSRHGPSKRRWQLSLCRSDLRADSARSACHVVERSSSMLIHPLFDVATPKESLGLAHDVTLLERFALVRGFFAPAKRKRQFDASGRRIERNGYQCQAFLI